MSHESVSTEPIAVFPLRTPPPFPRWLLALCGAVIGAEGAVMLVLLLFLLKLAQFSKPALVFGALPGALLGIVASLGPVARVVNPAAPMPPLRVEPTGLRLPRNIRSRREVWIPFEDLASLEVRRNWKQRLVLVYATNRVFLFPTHSFVQEADGERFVAEARRAVGVRSPELLRKIDQQDELAAAMNRVRPVATLAFLALAVVSFATTLALGGPTSAVLLRLGANAPVLERHGQWFRLFAGNFLHGGWLHIGLNLMALLTLGVALEQLFGTARYVVLFLVSALGGSVASMLVGGHVFSVGMSTALFGLFGGWAFAAWRFRHDLPARLRRSRRWWVMQLGINGALSALPVVDWAAHLGGIVTGVLISAILLSSAKEFRGAAGIGVKGAASGLAALFSGAMAVSVRYAVRSESVARDAALATLELPQATAGMLNNLAWDIAIDPKSDAAALSMARDAIDRAVAVRPSDFGTLDTSATVRHRQGEDADAVELECIALRLEHQANPDCGACRQRKEFESQLARFLISEQRDPHPIRAARALALEAPHAPLAQWTPNGMVLSAPTTGFNNLHAYAYFAGASPTFLELGGPLRNPTNVDVRSLPIARDPPPTPTFACVDWGEAVHDTFGARYVPLEPSILMRP